MANVYGWKEAYHLFLEGALLCELLDDLVEQYRDAVTPASPFQKKAHWRYYECKKAILTRCNGYESTV